MPWAVPVAMAAGSLAGSLIGDKRAAGAQQAAQEAAQAAVDQLKSLGMPPDMARQVILQQYKQAGTLTPELEKAINLGPSAVANIQEDPTLRNAQMQALQQYQQAGHTGFTAQDQLNNQRMQNQVNGDNQSRIASIIQGAQQRGESGSGASLAAQLLGTQSAANNESEQGLQLAAQGNNARMAALGQSAGLGGQIRNQDFSNAQTKANAADQFQRFNVQNQQQTANQNVNLKNQAQQYNLGQAQQLSNANVGNANQEALRENQGRLQNWQNEMARNQTIANADLGQATQLQGQADRIRGQAQQFGSGIGLIGGAIGAQAFGGGGSTSGGGSTTGNGFGNTSGSSVNTAQHGNTMAGGAADNMDPSVGYAAHGGMVPHYADGGQIACYDMGGNVPGHAMHPGDNYANDMKHVMLSPDEIVVPRSITTSPDAAERAKEFVKGVLASKQMRR